MFEVSGCALNEVHACNESKQLDFRVVGDIEGEWRNESGNTQFSFDANGHIHSDIFGCAHGKYPIVEGDYNTFYGGPSHGRVKLVEAKLEPGQFELNYKSGKGKNFPVNVVRGEIVAPGTMHYTFMGSSIHVLHRWRPGDEEPTGTSEGTDVSSTGTTEDSEEMMTTDTGAEVDSGTEGSGL